MSGPLDDRLAELHGLPRDFGRADLEALQFARLNATIAHARRNSPFYRARRDWPEGEIRDRRDLARLPFTTAADLARADPSFLAVSQSEVERIVTLPTSGTVGPAKRVSFTAGDREATFDFFQHGMALFTRPGDRVVVAFPAERPGGVGDGLVAALTRLGATPVIAPSEASPAELADLLRRSGARIAAGPPVRLLAAARVSAADGGAPIRLDAALVSSDHASASLRRGLERAWGCAVHDHWGMTETGYGGAVECAAHAGLHVREADLLVEVVDPATGAALGVGESGEIVVSTLGRRAMPLLRLRTGDRGRLIDAPCVCGSRLMRLDGIEGRFGDAAVLPGGVRLSMPRLDELLFALDGVCDVAARLTEGAPSTLRLTIAATARAKGEAAATARAAIVADAGLGPLVTSGALRLDVVEAEGALLLARGKRRLIREDARCAGSS
ncbi:MAG: AMP-binding protein [Hyphomicrobiales bacterium]|nr:AMP-binding protein [Hyphomicrobiales bacterium]